MTDTKAQRTRVDHIVKALEPLALASKAIREAFEKRSK